MNQLNVVVRLSAHGIRRTISASSFTEWEGVRVDKRVMSEALRHIRSPLVPDEMQGSFDSSRAMRTEWMSFAAVGQ